MTFFAIRDDDTSAWTDPGDLALVYRGVWDRGIPVSLAVIPQGAKTFHAGDPENFFQEEETRRLEENADLVGFLRLKIGEGLLDIMLHGYDHFYWVGKERHSPERPATRQWLAQLRREKSGGSLDWIGECLWKDSARMNDEILSGRKILESVLDCKVRVFVPPSNQIGRGGIRAVEAAGLDLSGIMGPYFDRPFSLKYLASYFKRWGFRFLKGRPYPHVLDLGMHRELVAYSLTPGTSFESLKDSLAFCCRNQAPFVLSTHYWELKQNPNMRQNLIRLCDEALRLGLEPLTVSESFCRASGK